jgi:hypothetical protein
MNANSNEAERDRRALAISVWENEGGSRAPDKSYSHGRRNYYTLTAADFP